MAPVVAVVAKVATAIFAKVTFAAVAKFVVTTALSIGVSKLLAKRAMSSATAGGDGGGRIQLPPGTDNKIPVVYGSAFIGGSIIDAYLTPDQKTMYYVVALAEVTDTSAGSTISYGDIYYDGKLATFTSDGSGGTTKVSVLTNNATSPAQQDTRINGYLNIYLYRNGSTGATSGTNTTQNAYDVFPNWSGNPNYAMTNCAFAIVKLVYSTDAGTTSLGSLTAQVKNTESGQATGVFRPGTAIYDYMTNTRYGCSIPANQIDDVNTPGTSLYNLNIYSDQTITVTGGPSPTQARYRINGPLDTGSNCLNNLQFLVDSCDSWLQYSELTGKWKVVMNKAYTQSPGAQATGNLFIVNSSNLVGGIEISPIDLNETYNQVEVAYPNFNVKDQTDYQIIDLFVTNPSLLSQNEAVNRLNVTLPLVNNAVQAKYLAARRIYQSREDLVISFRTDYSGIQVEAGDVIRVYHETYGWDADNGFPDGKLFRVSEVIEEKDAEGNLFATFRCFEYNATVYTDNPVADFIPAFNTGLKNPNIISIPGTPTIAGNPAQDSQIESFKVTSAVPEEGVVIYMDFNYGNTSNVQTHVLYRSVQLSPGVPFTNSPNISIGNVTNVSIDINDLPAGNYYFSTTARNDFAGRSSNTSNVYNWAGANLQPVTTTTICNVSSNGNIFTHTATPNVNVGSFITLISGNGVLQNLTQVAQVNSNTEFVATLTPTTPLSNACIELSIGGIVNINIQPQSVGFVQINGNANPTFRNYQTIHSGVYANGVASGFANLKSNTYLSTYPVPFVLAETSAYDYNYTYPWAQGTSTTANGYLANSTTNFTPGNAAILINPPSSDRWYKVSSFPLTWGPNNVGYYGNLNINSQFTADSDMSIQILPYYKINGNANVITNTTQMATFTIPLGVPVTVNQSFFFPRMANSNLSANNYLTEVGWYIRNLGNGQLGCTSFNDELLIGRQFNQDYVGGTY
jgi:hypothetical protein